MRACGNFLIVYHGKARRTQNQQAVPVAHAPAGAGGKGGLPRAVIEKVASLDMDEIDELAETVPVSLYTFRLTDSALERLLQMPRDAKSTYAEATLL